MDDEGWRVAREAWPGVTLERETFARFLDERSIPETEDGMAELYLACACLQGDRVAVERVEQQYMPVVAQAIAHMKVSAAVADEVEQHVRTQLLMGTGERPPRLADYAGQGKLRGLVRVMSVRAAISLLRKNKRHEPGNEEALLGIASPDLDPELMVMKARYRSEFSQAFEAAIANLGSRDRNVLRLHLVDGLTVEQVGGLYQVHRATATRWLAKIREDLLGDTRKRMQRALQIDSGELDSVMRLIQSRLDVSVQRMLETRHR